MSSQQIFDAPRHSIFRFRPNEVIIIGLDTTDTQEHPLYDIRAIAADQKETPFWDPELASSIKARGVLQPIKIAKLDGHTKPVVVDGRRRVVHARDVERSTGQEIWIKGDVVKGDMLLLATAKRILNDFRLNENPVELGRQFSNLKSQGYTDTAIAQATGYSTATVARYMAVLTLDAESIADVATGKVAPELAPKLVEMDKDKRRDLIAQIAGKSRRQAREVVAVAEGAQKAARPGVREVRSVVKHRVLPPDALLMAQWFLGEAELPESWGAVSDSVPVPVEEERI